MSKYFRITAYNKEENISVIMDSNGKFDKLWQFSSYMVAKGFSIIEVGGEDKFQDGDLLKVNIENNKLALRAYSKGKPLVNGNTIQVSDKKYSLL